jgi:hypothetical protein
MYAETLRKQWLQRAAGAPFHPKMTFIDDDLMLGNGSSLGCTTHVPKSAEFGLAPGGVKRAAALLTAAHARNIEPSVLRHISRAIAEYARGHRVLALIHLALTNLPPLEPTSNSAWRLSMADGMIADGLSPDLIIKELGFDPPNSERVQRGLNADQPRVPAGSGITSGQWTGSNDDRDDGVISSILISDSAPGAPATETSPTTTAASDDLSSPTSLTHPASILNWTCDDLWESDMQICTSINFADDPHYQGLCVAGAMRRFDACLAGEAIPNLLPY